MNEIFVLKFFDTPSNNRTKKSIASVNLCQPGGGGQIS